MECETPQLSSWLLLREAAKDAFASALDAPPDDLVGLSSAMISVNFDNRESLDAFWGRGEGLEWPYGLYCIFGHLTAYYLLAWASASMGQKEDCLDSLSKANHLLRQDNHDLLEHTSWPVSSWDILTNLHGVLRGLPFLPRHSMPQLPTWVRGRLPLVWPPMGPTCWPSCAPSRAGAPRRRLGVWWTAKHPGPFVDIVTILEQFATDRYDVKVHSHAVSEYCGYAPYRGWLCTSDRRVEEVLQKELVLGRISERACGSEEGQWCGLRRLHRNFDAVVEAFTRTFYRELSGTIDLFMCGHPVFWCKLYQNFQAPIVGVWDMSHFFGVPEELHQRWTGEFSAIFRSPRNILVAFTPYHSFAAKSWLGLSIPYFHSLAIWASQQGRYSPERRDEVLLASCNIPDHVGLLERFAEEAAGFPHRLVAFPKKLSCGTNCPKAELARFRAAVLCPYDLSPLKVMEFYAMAMPTFVQSSCIWRTSMRWAQTTPYTAGPFSAHEEAEEAVAKAWPGGTDGWVRVFENWNNMLRWDEPWPLNSSTLPPELPFPAFISSRRVLFPPAAAFWAQFSDWASLPHLLHYRSAGQLLAMLATQPLEELREVSAAMVRHYTAMVAAGLSFWRGLVVALVEEGSSEAWKGPAVASL
uniref:Uncharacterized protein n=1 Tax=Alexandrium monilatum TaxID=311494 RepID=A0A7S4VWY4_9DINO